MFGRQPHESLNGGTTHAWGWPRFERTRQRNRERADAELISEVRWQWRSACANTSLAPMIYTPAGATRAVPVIPHLDLRPPVAVTVKVRPGQSIADFVRAAPTIADAMDVMELAVTPLAPHWVRIVLVDRPAVRMPDTPPQPSAEAWRYGT